MKAKLRTFNLLRLLFSWSFWSVSQFYVCSVSISRFHRITLTKGQASIYATRICSIWVLRTHHHTALGTNCKVIQEKPCRLNDSQIIDVQFLCRYSACLGGCGATSSQAERARGGPRSGETQPAENRPAEPPLPSYSQLTEGSAEAPSQGTAWAQVCVGVWCTLNGEEGAGIVPKILNAGSKPDE